MRQVFVATNLVEAHLVKDHLVSFGIKAVIHGEILVGAVGELPADTYPTVWVVDNDDADRARSLVHGIVAEPSATQLFPDPWVCAECAESNDAPFTECWRCGYHRVK